MKKHLKSQSFFCISPSTLKIEKQHKKKMNTSTHNPMKVGGGGGGRRENVVGGGGEKNNNIYIYQ